MGIQKKLSDAAGVSCQGTWSRRDWMHWAPTSASSNFPEQSKKLDEIAKELGLNEKEVKG